MPWSTEYIYISASLCTRMCAHAHRCMHTHKDTVYLSLITTIKIVKKILPVLSQHDFEIKYLRGRRRAKSTHFTRSSHILPRKE